MDISRKESYNPRMKAPLKAEQLLLSEVANFLRETGAMEKFSEDIGIDRQPEASQIASQTVKSLTDLFAKTPENAIRLRTAGSQLGLPHVIDWVQQRNGKLLQQEIRADLEKHHPAVRMAANGGEEESFQLAPMIESLDMARQLRDWYELVSKTIGDRKTLLPTLQALLPGPDEKSIHYQRDFEGGRFLHIDGFAPPPGSLPRQNPVWYRYGNGDDDVVCLSFGQAQEVRAQQELLAYTKRPDAPKFQVKTLIQYAVRYYKRIAEEYARLIR